MTITYRMLVGAVMVLSSTQVATLRADEAEDKAVQLVEKLGGTVVRDVALKEMPVFRVDLHFSKVADADLSQLAGLKKLQLLNLCGTQVTDEGMKNLNGLKELKWLYLADEEKGRGKGDGHLYYQAVFLQPLSSEQEKASIENMDVPLSSAPCFERREPALCTNCRAKARCAFRYGIERIGRHASTAAQNSSGGLYP